MKTILNSICLTCLLSIVVNAQDSLPLVAIPGFADRTGSHATRVVPGAYREKNVVVGTDRTREVSEKDGTRTESESTRDQYEKQLERDIEFAPGDWKLPKQASLVAADAVASAMQSSGNFRVLDRSIAGLRTIDSERMYSATSGASADLIKICREKNAQFLVVGSVSSFRIDKREGVAYGVTRRLYMTRVNLDIRVIDVGSTEIVYQSNPTKTVSIQLPEGATEFTDIYDWEKVLRTAVTEAASELVTNLGQATGAIAPPEAMVKVNITSNPPGADILIDGDFAGNTPSELEVPARRFRLKIQRQGYQAWENEVMPREGMNVSPTLEMSPSPPPLHETEQ